MFCTNCGSQLDNDSRFCIRCGSPVKFDHTPTGPHPHSPLPVPIQPPAPMPAPTSEPSTTPTPTTSDAPWWFWVALAIGLIATVLTLKETGILPSSDRHNSASAESRVEATYDTERPKWTAPTPTDAPIFFEETVIYDDSEIKITAVELTNERNSFDLSFLVENNSSRNIAVCGDYFLVNGAVIEEDIYIRAASGKKGYGTLSLSKGDLDAAGVDMIATITSGDFRITVSDSYREIYFVPFTIETSFADQYTSPESSAGKLLYENNGLKVTFLTMRRDYSGYDVYLLIQNDTSYMLTADAENLSVNGFTIGIWMYEQIYPGTARVCAFRISDSTLNESNLTDISEITFEVRFVKDLNTLYRTGELTISVN